MEKEKILPIKCNTQPVMKNENIFVFKTNIENPEQAKKLRVLDEVKEVIDWSLDLEDCDNVLRIVGGDMNSEKMIRLMGQMGFYCEELSYH